MRSKQGGVLCYVRASLRRRLFVWFATSILITSCAVGAVMHLGSGAPSSWKREAERLRVFVSGRFEQVWDDAAERDALARAIQRDFDVTVGLRGQDGEALGTFGPRCTAAVFEAPVTKNGHRVGKVTICAERYGPRPWKIVVPLTIACLCLWGAAGAIARRLARPFGEIAKVAGDLGAGKLESRVPLRRDQHGEIAAVACAINDMAARIEAHVGEQRKLLATVSHELRTPLARIRLLTELARERCREAPNGTIQVDPKTLDELDREVMEIDALVGDLLASSRLDFQVLSRRPVDATEAASRALERAGEEPSKLVVEGDAPMVRADATLLARALANLIDNAKQHGGGLDALRISKQNGHLVLVAEDRGTGFVDGEEQRVFEPFFRRGEAGSLGLGLSLVKRIAEAHGGVAYAENRREGGARVGIELPVAASDSEPA
jgi:two-component system, OmpR family, sensor kinase